MTFPTESLSLDRREAEFGRRSASSRSCLGKTPDKAAPSSSAAQSVYKPEAHGQPERRRPELAGAHSLTCSRCSRFAHYLNCCCAIRSVDEGQATRAVLNNWIVRSGGRLIRKTKRSRSRR